MEGRLTCDADGQALVEMNLELEPELEANLQKWADARGLSLEEAGALLIGSIPHYGLMGVVEKIF